MLFATTTAYILIFIHSYILLLIPSQMSLLTCFISLDGDHLLLCDWTQFFKTLLLFWHYRIISQFLVVKALKGIILAAISLDLWMCWTASGFFVGNQVFKVISRLHILIYLFLVHEMNKATIWKILVTSFMRGLSPVLR